MEQLLAEWDDEQNAPLTPQTISYGSSRRVWWKCGKGHSWQTAVYSRNRGSGCPYCTGRYRQAARNDLAARYPSLAQEWDMEKNWPVMPRDVPADSSRIFWWKCSVGHGWRSSVRTRTSGGRCPVCEGKKMLPGQDDLATLKPELAAQWDYERNKPYLPQSVRLGGKRRFWWRCPKGHVWRTTLATRMAGMGCPYCGGAKVERGFNDLAAKAPEIAAE